MKKIALIACAIATSAIAFALPTQRKAEKVAPATPKIHFVQQMDAQPHYSLLAQTAEITKSDTTWGIYKVANLPEFHSGTPSSGIGYINEAAIIVPYLPTSTFVVLSNGYSKLGKASWYIGDSLVAKDTNYYWQKDIAIGGTYPVPTMKMAKAQLTDTTEVVFNDYQFGALFTSYYTKYGFENYLSVAPDWASMTQCAMYTEDPGDAKYPSYGNDWTFVGAGSYGSYAYGTGLMPDPTKTGEYFDTIFAPITNKDIMYFSNISVGIYTFGTAVLGENDSVQLGIYSLSSKGAINWANPLYTAYATIDDYNDYEDGQTGWYGTLEFNFYEEDEWGTLMQVPAIVEGNFVVAFININKGTADFGIIQDYYSPFTGQTYLIKNGKMTQMWQSPSNLLINFYGVMPVAKGLPTSMNYPYLTAAEATFDVPNNVWDEDWEIYTEDGDLPEWLDIQIEGEYDTIPDEEAEEGYYLEYKYNTKMTVSFTEATEYREVPVTINLLGKEYNILFSQGEKPSGLNEVKFINDNKRYDVLGKEVDDNYKGVVIINGKKMLQ